MPDPLPPVRHPARFVPLSAIAVGEVDAAAVPVSGVHPLPCREQPFRDVRELVPGTPVAAGIALLVDCNAGGTASFALSGGSSLSLTLSPGLTLLPLAVVSLAAAGLTADLTAWVLD
jgi:hypothetical protein